jgi:hypothetical protein
MLYAVRDTVIIGIYIGEVSNSISVRVYGISP